MAGRIRQEDLQAVRERSDIVKLVSGYLQLKKAGRDSMVGICPFHPEKTPSFSVSPGKQVFYCFGCGQGGDVFHFLEKVENLTFTEAVERLAREAGVTVRFEGETPGDRRAHGRRKALLGAVAEAARLYHHVLAEGREGKDAREYLASRGMSKDSIERFGVGYAPGYPDYLLKRMSRSYSVDLLHEAGLLARDGSGNVRDRFRGRVMFPIHDLSGDPVAFGGRLLPGPGAPPGAAKYVNSPDSAIYHKGNLLYNLHRAKASATRSGRAWVVEGYTDVIALDQAGLAEGVATCGTSLGEEHVRLLARFTERVVLAFDSDEAGARAAERAFQFHEAHAVDVSVLVLPEGQDPADFALAHGGGREAGEAFESLEETATPLVVYMIERALVGRDLSNVEEQARAVRAGVEIIGRLDDPVRRERYGRLLADRVGVDVQSVVLELGRMGARPDGRGMPPSLRRDVHEGAGAVRLRPNQKVEREVLKLLIQAPEASHPYLDRMGADLFTRAEHRRAFEIIRSSRPGERVRDGAAGLVAAGAEQGEPMGDLLAELSMESLQSVDGATEEYVRQVFLRLQEFGFKSRADALRKQLERLNPIKAADEYDTLYEEFVRLEGERRRVRVEQEQIGAPS